MRVFNEPMTTKEIAQRLTSRVSYFATYETDDRKRVIRMIEEVSQPEHGWSAESLDIMASEEWLTIERKVIRNINASRKCLGKGRLR